MVNPGRYYYENGNYLDNSKLMISIFTQTRYNKREIIEIINRRGR